MCTLESGSCIHTSASDMLLACYAIPASSVSCLSRHHAHECDMFCNTQLILPSSGLITGDWAFSPTAQAHWHNQEASDSQPQHPPRSARQLFRPSSARTQSTAETAYTMAGRSAGPSNDHVSPCQLYLQLLLESETLHICVHATAY